MGSYKKKLFIVLLLFLLISFFACSSVNASVYNNPEWYTIDANYLLCQEQEYYAKLYIYCLQSLNVSTQNFYKNVFENYSVYFVANSNNTDGVLRIRLYVYDKGTSFNGVNTYEHSLSLYGVSNSDLTIPSLCFQVNTNSNNHFLGFVFCNVDAKTCTTSYNQDATLNLPVTLVHYNNNCVNSYLNGDLVTKSDIDSLLIALDNIKDEQENTTQAVNNLRNDFNQEESDDDYDFPTSNPTTDPTSSGIDNIFNMFYMRINSWNALGINVPIPFTGKSFTINPDITENIINGWTPSTQIATVFKTLLSGVWYYLLGRYIVKDVQHYVDGLQTGDILTKSDTNIKTEML